MDDAGKFDPEAAWDRILKNRRTLDACQRHSFPSLPLEAIRLGAKVTCERCGGTMALTELQAYIRGYEAAGKSGNDIMPGFREVKTEPTAPIQRKFFRSED